MPTDFNIQYRSSTRKRPLILVTNDDGYQAEGIKHLSESLSPLGDILVVAPTTEQSAMSHALTLHKPFRVREVKKNLYTVDGTPTDCVNFAMNFILKGHRPDLLVSGINQGQNLGDDIHYSGTVSAAIEGGVFGVPSIAVSASPTEERTFLFEPAAAFAVKAAKAVLEKGLPKDVILNVNVPALPAGKIKGYRVTKQGKKNYGDITQENIGPHGDKYYWISGKYCGYDDIDRSDCKAIGEHYISITPIHVNVTDQGFLKELATWKI